MTDFGGTIKSEDCFGLYALDKNMSYSEAIVEIGRELQNNRGVQIFEEETREFYKYEFRQCEKKDFKNELADEQRKLNVPTVTQEQWMTTHVWSNLDISEKINTFIDKINKL